MVGEYATQHRQKAPSRATIYNFVARCPPHEYSMTEPPVYVRDALYNLGASGIIPGHQLACYAFQYGDVRAASFAAGLPWLDLYQADRLRAGDPEATVSSGRRSAAGGWCDHRSPGPEARDPTQRRRRDGGPGSVNTR